MVIMLDDLSDQVLFGSDSSYEYSQKLWLGIHLVQVQRSWKEWKSSSNCSMTISALQTILKNAQDHVNAFLTENEEHRKHLHKYTKMLKVLIVPQKLFSLFV